METATKIKIMAISLLVGLISALILVFIPVIHLYLKEFWGFEETLPAKIAAIIMSAVVIISFSTSGTIFFNLIRHPVPWKGI